MCGGQDAQTAPGVPSPVSYGAMRMQALNAWVCVRSDNVPNVRQHGGETCEGATLLEVSLRVRAKIEN